MKNNYFDERLLVQYGFIFTNGKYIYEKIIYEELKLIVYIKNNTIDTKIIDLEFNDEYLPFKQESFGIFSSQIYDLVKNTIDDIIDKCSYDKKNRSKILEYVKQKYQTIPKYSWNNH